MGLPSNPPLLLKWGFLFLSRRPPSCTFSASSSSSSSPPRGKKRFNSSSAAADESSLIPLYVGHQSKRAQDDVEGATKRREKQKETDGRTDGRTESLSSLAEDDGFGLAPLGLLGDLGREGERDREREFVFAPASE